MGLGLGALGSESPVFQRRQENARSAAMKQEAQERALAEEEQKRIDAMEPAEQLRHLKKQYHSLCFKYNSVSVSCSPSGEVHPASQTRQHIHELADRRANLRLFVCVCAGR